MKICMLIGPWFPFVGGGQVHVKNLIKALEKDYRCHIDLFHSPSSHILIRACWCFCVLPQVLIKNLFENYDLIHAHAYEAGFPGKIISLVLRKPIVFTLHGSNNLDLDNKGPIPFLEKTLLTRIKYDYQITPASNFLKHPNVNQKIAIIPNGVNLSLFKKRATKKPKEFTILFVGRLAKIKGVPYLIKAFKELNKAHFQTKLLIAGEGPQKNELKSQVKKFKLEKKVKFLGTLSYKNLIKVYQTSDLFVLPSISEGQPLTLLEAWAAKLPVVVTAVGENPKMVKNGVNGYLFKPRDAKDLTRRLKKAILNPNLKKMGETGFKFVSKNLTWEKTAQKVYEIYRKLV